MPAAVKIKPYYIIISSIISVLVLLIFVEVISSDINILYKYIVSVYSVIIFIFLYLVYYLSFKTLKKLEIQGCLPFPQFILNDALNYVTDHIVITDKDGIVLYANEMAEKITGFSLSEIIGKKVGSKETWGGQMSVDFYSGMWKKINNGKKFSGFIKNKKKNGELYDAYITIFPVKIKSNLEYFVSLERDITHEKELDKMKTDFISLASHQLRTPLSAMKWYLEMLLDGDAGELSEEQKSFIQNIDNSNERMIELVNSLLNISRVESGRLIIDPKETNIIEVIEDVISDVKPKAKERGITFLFEGVPSLPIIISDPKLIRNVYMNLLTNAIKYTPNGGSVTLKISKNATDIVSEVTDTGMGIPKKDQEKIFTRFFRAENARAKVTDGNGLGLYLVKSVVEVCGGKIWFTSQIGKGTTFSFTLPLKGIPAKKGEVSIES